MEIVAATGNMGKVREFDRILGKLGFSVIPMQKIGIDMDIPETGTTFSENALIKAKTVSKLCNLPVLADDSGLCVEALGGAPGLYSARFAGENATDYDRRQKILEEMKEISNRNAYFISSLALVFPDGELITAEAKVFGKIMQSEVGTGGFGYDPIFFSDELNKSFGLATPDEKNKVSHRGRALMELYKKLEMRGKK